MLLGCEGIDRFIYGSLLLKNVAHNLGHSFTSLMNFAGTDYAMGPILRFARQTGHDTLRINLVTGEAEPPELLAPPITELPVRYMQLFWYLVERYGSDRSFVQDARLAASIHRKRAPRRSHHNFRKVPTRATSHLSTCEAKSIWRTSRDGCFQRTCIIQTIE